VAPGSRRPYLNRPTKTPHSSQHQPHTFMGYEVHVIRQSDSGEKIEITLDEWNKFIESDPDFEVDPEIRARG
jgi:hypothetical protein